MREVQFSPLAEDSLKLTAGLASEADSKLGPEGDAGDKASNGDEDIDDDKDVDEETGSRVSRGASSRQLFGQRQGTCAGQNFSTLL